MAGARSRRKKPKTASPQLPTRESYIPTPGDLGPISHVTWYPPRVKIKTIPISSLKRLSDSSLLLPILTKALSLAKSSGAHEIEVDHLMAALGSADEDRGDTIAGNACADGEA